MARSRSRLWLALDLALAARKALERRVIEAEARIAELEREFAYAQDCAFGAQAPNVGLARDDRLGLLMENH